MGLGSGWGSGWRWGLGQGQGSGWGSGWRCGVWVRVRGRVRVQGGGWRAWLVEFEAATTEGTTATLADPLAIDQNAGRAWGKDGLGLG